MKIKITTLKIEPLTAKEQSEMIEQMYAEEMITMEQRARFSSELEDAKNENDLNALENQSSEQ